MEKSHTRTKLFAGSIVASVWLYFFLLHPLCVYSQVIVTETEEEMTSGEVTETILPDSLKARLKIYQQHYINTHRPDIFNTSQLLATTCNNSNFSTGTFNNWIGGWGKWNAGGIWHVGLDTNTVPPWPYGNYQCYSGTTVAACPPLHSLIHSPGTWDVNTGDSLISVFPGEPYSARLGHSVGGAHKAELKYNVYVGDSTYLFVYRYAVILQNPPHSAAQQPSFTIEVQDSTGAVIDSACGYYYIYAHLNANGQPPPTWHKHGPSNNVIIWKEWTTVGMSLANWVGHHVTIVFIIKDCSQGGHFGYAYLSTYCSYLTVQTAMCEGDTSATLTAPPGFAYSWTTGDTTQSITVPHPITGSTYGCTLTAVNGCQVTITQTLTYTVIHANFTHGNVCAGLGTQFTDSTWVSQNNVTNWKWNFGDGSPDVVGVQNPVHVFATPGDFSVKLKAYSTEGCLDSIIKIVHADSVPEVTNLQLVKTICSRANTNILLTASVTNSTFTWTATSKYGTTTGFSGGSGSTISQAPTNNGKHTDTLFYFVTPHRGACAGNVKQFRVAVKPLPKPLSTSMVKVICDSTLTNVNITPYSDSTRFTWTCSASSLNLSGYASNTTLPDTLINQLLKNSGWTTDTVYYHLVPQASGCYGDTFVYKVAVYPLPDTYFNPGSQSLCSAQTTSIQIESHVSGVNFSWSASSSSLNITGFSGGSGSQITQTLTNSGSTFETVTYTATASVTGCSPGPPHAIVVTVKPKPVVTNTTRTSGICSAHISVITPQSTVSGSNYAWTASGSSINVSGYSNGTGLTITQTLSNSGFNVEVVTYSVTPTANGCQGDTALFRVLVYPVTDVYFTPPIEAICSQQTTAVTNNSHVVGTSYTWTATGSSGNVNGFAPGSGNLIQQTLNNISYSVETVTYHVTPSAHGCTGTSSNGIVTVDPKPGVNLVTCWDPVTTVTARPILLKGGTPLNGIYRGTGVSSGSFYPSVAGVGTFTIQYTFVNLFNCSETANSSIVVISPPAFSCGDSLVDVRDGKKYPTVQIGTQCWMAANLNYGSSIVSSQMQRDNCVTEKYCFNNNPANCSGFGGLYQWDELMQYDTTQLSQGFCPPGWHLPSESDWSILFSVYISNGFAGSPLKYTGYSGFNALLSGVRHVNVTWDFTDFAVMYWSSTPHGPLKAWAHGMNSYDPSVSVYPGLRNNAFYARCLKD